MALSKLLLLLWIGLTASHPATRLDPVSTSDASALNLTKVEVGATHSGKVEVTLPFQIASKEQLIAWVTYAMRIMASRINITLAAADPEVMPPEKIEKLKNSSVAINHFLEKVNRTEEGRMPEIDRRIKTVSMGGLKHEHRTEPPRRTTTPPTNCKKLERQLHRLTSTTAKPIRLNDMQTNFDIHASRPITKIENNRPFTQMTLDPQNNRFETFTKYIQELALINPYDHPDNKVFRDPDIFPPFNLQHQQQAYLPLPVKPAYHEENLKQYYAMANRENISQQNLYGVRTDPLGSLQLVPVRNKFNQPITPHKTRTELDDLNSGGFGITYKQQAGIDAFSTTLSPIISVPFEAVITLTRETDSLTPSPLLESTSSKKGPTTLQRGTKNSASSSQKKKKKISKDRDNRHAASASDARDTFLPSPVQGNKNKSSKKKDTGKTTVRFGDEKPTSKSKKKKEKPSNKKQLSALQLLLRMLTLVNGNATTPSLANVVTNISKKFPNTRNLQSSYRGKRNETSQKQVDGDDDDEEDNEDDDDADENGDGGDDGDDDERDNDNDDNGRGGVGGSADERDIFDDDDDGFDDDDDYDDNGGSLGSLADLIPLIIPILEDISDPESDTDLKEFILSAIPLLQGLSEPDPETGEGPDSIGIIAPLLQNLFIGQDGEGSDSGAILGPILQLLGPFIGPLSGPLIGPLSSSSSGPNGSSIGALLSALLTPLSMPTKPGGMSPIAALTADIIALLSKELSAPGSGVDLGALVSQLVVGTSAGTSAGLSGSSSGGSLSAEPEHPTAYGPPTASQVDLRPPSVKQQHSTSFNDNRNDNQRPSLSPPPKKNSLASFLRPQATQYRPQATHPEITHSEVTEQPHVRPQRLPPSAYHHEQIAAPANYGGYGPPYAVPANKVNSFDLLGKAFKQIIASGVNLFTGILGASTATSGASGASSSDGSGDTGGGYGPPQQGYGPPQQGYGPPQQGYNQNYKPDSYQNIH